MKLKSLFGLGAALLACAGSSASASGIKTFKQYERGIRRDYLNETATEVARLRFGKPSYADNIKEVFKSWADSNRPVQEFMDEALQAARHGFESFNSKRNDKFVSLYKQSLKDDPTSHPSPSDVAARMEGAFSPNSIEEMKSAFSYFIMHKAAEAMFHDEWNKPESAGPGDLRKINFLPGIDGEFLEILGYGSQYVQLNKLSSADLKKLLEE